MTDQEFFNDWIEGYRKNLKKFIDKNQILFERCQENRRKKPDTNLKQNILTTGTMFVLLMTAFLREFEIANSLILTTMFCSTWFLIEIFKPEEETIKL